MQEDLDYFGPDHGYSWEYQCTELAIRYAAVVWREGANLSAPEKAWDDAGWSGSAQDMWSVAPKLPVPLEQIPNGRGAPHFGDLIVFSKPGGPGHVGVVVKVSGGRLCFVGENQANAPAEAWIPISGNTASPGGDFSNSLQPLGWLRGPTPQPVTNGEFVSYAGGVYRIAGGAPLWVDSWTPYGGPQPTTALSAAAWASLAQYPVSGTTLAVADGSKGMYKVAGGAPLYLNSCDAGCGSPVPVNQWTIDHDGAPPGYPAHLTTLPANGTFLHVVDNDSYDRVAGGAALPVSNCAALGESPCDGAVRPLGGADPSGIARSAPVAHHDASLPA